MILLRLFPLLTLPLLLIACSGDDPSRNAAAASSTTAAPTPPTNRIDIPPAVRKNLGITFAKVEKRRIGQTIRVPGHFELLPEARMEYRAALPGRIEFLVQQYQRIEPGTPLYRIQSPDWPTVQQEIAAAQAAISAAQSDVDVAQALVSEGETRIALLRDRIAALAGAEIRRAELDLQLAELESSLPRLRAQLHAARSTLSAAERRFDFAMDRAATLVGLSRAELEEPTAANGRERPRWQAIDWIHINAVRGGRVESLALTPGGWADTGSLVLTTVDPAMLRFRALGLQSDLPRLRDHAPALIIPPHAASTTLAPIQATLTIGLEADPAARTIALLATPVSPGDEPAAERAAPSTDGQPLVELPDWARPGVSAFLEIQTAGAGLGRAAASGAPAETWGGEELVIPRSAIVQDGLTHIIFRRDPANPDKAIRLEADLGLSDGRWTVINSGVRLGDEVVLDGVYELKLATSGTTQKGGHFHADGTFHTEDH